MTTKITIYNVYDDRGAHNVCYVQNGKPPTNDRCCSIYMYSRFIYCVWHKKNLMFNKPTWGTAVSYWIINGGYK